MTLTVLFTDGTFSYFISNSKVTTSRMRTLPDLLLCAHHHPLLWIFFLLLILLMEKYRLRERHSLP